MKRCIFLLLALLLLSACGNKAIPSSQAGPSSAGGLTVSQPEEDRPKEDPEETDKDDAIPQADVALVREIVFTYGAKEDTVNHPGAIILKNKSLFLREESWSGENGLTPFYYLLWEDSLPVTDEEWAVIEEGQRYAEGRQGESPFGYGYLGPGEMVEEKILSHFEVTLEHLRGDPEYYDGSIPGYFLPAGGGMGERPAVSFTFRQDGDILTIPVTLTYTSTYTSDGLQPEELHTLTVRLEPGGGWKYLGCQVSDASQPDPEPEPSQLEIIQPPAVPHGEELAGVDFSAMDKSELTTLLQPVLDRAAFFCQFGRVWYPHTTNLITDEDFAASILWPYDRMDLDYHPFLNLPYQTVEELWQDMGTVFTPDNFDQDLKFIFEGLTDYEGRLFYVGVINGYLFDRKWELDKMEIEKAERDKLTVSMPVSWPATPASTWGDAQGPFAAPLRFEMADGYILVDSSYFVKKPE